MESKKIELNRCNSFALYHYAMYVPMYVHVPPHSTLFTKAIFTGCSVAHFATRGSSIPDLILVASFLSLGLSL